jgi:hypothetical protein
LENLACSNEGLKKIYLPNAFENSRKDKLTEPNLQEWQNLMRYYRLETENLDPKIQDGGLNMFEKNIFMHEIQQQLLLKAVQKDMGE